MEAPEAAKEKEGGVKNDIKIAQEGIGDGGSLLGSDRGIRKKERHGGKRYDDGRRTTLCVLYVKGREKRQVRDAREQAAGASIVGDVAKMRLNPGR
jgi:hypothetical protein